MQRINPQQAAADNARAKDFPMLLPDAFTEVKVEAEEKIDFTVLYGNHASERLFSFASPSSDESIGYKLQFFSLLHGLISFYKTLMDSINQLPDAAQKLKLLASVNYSLEQVIDQIHKLKTKLFEPGYADTQRSEYFAELKLNLERIIIFFRQNNFSLAYQLNIFNRVVEAFDQCSLGLHQHLASIYQDLTTPTSLEYGLAKYRYALIEDFSIETADQKAEEKQHIDGVYEIHLKTLYNDYARAQKWHPLGTQIKDHFVVNIKDAGNVETFHEFFTQRYTPYKIIQHVKFYFSEALSKLGLSKTKVIDHSEALQDQVSDLLRRWGLPDNVFLIWEAVEETEQKPPFTLKVKLKTDWEKDFCKVFLKSMHQSGRIIHSAYTEQLFDLDCLHEEISILRTSAENYFELNQHPKAIEALEKAYQLAVNFPQPNDFLYILIGSIQLKLMDYTEKEQRIERYKIILSAFSSIKDRRKLIPYVATLKKITTELVPRADQIQNWEELAQLSLLTYSLIPIEKMDENEMKLILKNTRTYFQDKVRIINSGHAAIIQLADNVISKLKIIEKNDIISKNFYPEYLQYFDICYAVGYLSQTVKEKFDAFFKAWEILKQANSNNLPISILANLQSIAIWMVENAEQCKAFVTSAADFWIMLSKMILMPLAGKPDPALLRAASIIYFQLAFIPGYLPNGCFDLALAQYRALIKKYPNERFTPRDLRHKAQCHYHLYQWIRDNSPERNEVLKVDQMIVQLNEALNNLRHCCSLREKDLQLQIEIRKELSSNHLRLSRVHLQSMNAAQAQLMQLKDSKKRKSETAELDKEVKDDAGKEEKHPRSPRFPRSPIKHQRTEGFFGNTRRIEDAMVDEASAVPAAAAANPQSSQ